MIGTMRTRILSGCCCTLALLMSAGCSHATYRENYKRQPGKTMAASEAHRSYRVTRPDGVPFRVYLAPETQQKTQSLSSRPGERTFRITRPDGRHYIMRVVPESTERKDQ